MARAESTARALGLTLSERQLVQLEGHLALIAKWNRVYNLTAVREPAAMQAQHLADCLAAVAAVMRRVPAGHPPRILDVGSGAGLPGVVMAICLPQSQVTCVDAVGKKAAFLRQVGLELGLANLQARHARVEALDSGDFDLIVSRAFASLRDFTELTQRLLAPGGVWAAMKGRSPDDELHDLPLGIDVFHVEQLDVPGLDAERCIIWMGLHR